MGEPFQVLLNDQFVADIPGEELPNLAWFGVGCPQDTEERFWNHAETDKLALLYIRANGLFTKRVSALKTVRADV